MHATLMMCLPSGSLYKQMLFEVHLVQFQSLEREKERGEGIHADRGERERERERVIDGLQTDTCYTWMPSEATIIMELTMIDVL